MKSSVCATYSDNFPGRDPVNSILLIHDLSLHAAIFLMPPSITSTFSSKPSQSITSVSAATLLQTLLGTASPSSCLAGIPTLHKALTSSALSVPGTVPRLFLAAALTPFHGITYVDAKKKPHLAVEAAIREGTRLGVQNHYLDGIPALFASSELLSNAILTKDKHTTASERVALGKLRYSFALVYYVY